MVHVVISDSDTTDHVTVITGIDNRSSKNCPGPKIISQTNYDDVVTALSDLNWNDFYKESDVNVAAQLLVNEIGLAIKKCTTLKKIRRAEVIIQPWMTKSLLKCARRKDSLHIEAKNHPDNLAIQLKFKNYRNLYNRFLRSQKNKYESNQLNTHKNNSKKLWSTVKGICDIKVSKASTDDLLKIKSTKIESLNHANSFFSSVGNDLAQNTLSKLDKTEHQLASSILVDNSPTHSLFLAPTDISEISKIISGLKSSSAPGCDNINNMVLKRASHILASPIAHVCNLSMIQGLVPTCFKVADICPIYKSGSTVSVSNYRPISLLPSLSKILEKVVNKRLLSFLEKNDLLSPNQFGFRSNKSTEDAVVALVNQVSANLDSKKKSIGVFLDLAKAFDTVSWPILLRKLELLGVRGTALGWFCSYLNDRKQRVRISNQYSDYTTVTFGVPQGSVLGPTLFLAYINDLCQLIINKANLYTFADDTALVFHGNSWDEVKNVAEQGLAQVANWLQNNLLTLNASKTKYMAFRITQKSRPKETSLKLHYCNSRSTTECDCPVLECVDHVKYLGIKIDHKLTFDHHIATLRNRLRKMVHIFKRLGTVADPKTLRTVYLALCQSLINYCIVCWGSAAEFRMMKIERAQRALLKVAYKKPYRYPSDKLYDDTKFLPVRQLYILAATLRFHKTALFELVRTKRNTNRRNAWALPKTRTAHAQNTFAFKGPFLYQYLDNKLQIAETTRFVCKKKVTLWLSSQNHEDTQKIISVIK